MAPRWCCRLLQMDRLNFALYLLVGMLVSIQGPVQTLSERVSMKIVEEPSSYGFNQAYGQVQNTNTETTLKMRVKPSNFSGPSHLQRLVGKCFSLVTDSYKYDFCPFSNVTQHEKSLRWNPYSGILGVWQEWEIVNNTFISMIFREGDKCGKIYRSSQISFSCNKTNVLMTVSEPSTCNYHFQFSTPYVCHPHSMLVYPTLPDHLQREWDALEGELSRELITEKGYNKMLRKIFEKAGYYLSPDAQDQISKQALDGELQVEKEKRGEFDTLLKCTEEYEKLRKELDQAKATIEQKDQQLAENVGHERNEMDWHDIYD